MAQVFVTGGSGFIGRVLVRRLLAEGNSVRALVRSEASAEVVAALGAEPVRGELTDPSTWRDALTGCDVVFHLAAETDITADRARHDLVTVGGTRAVVAAARHAKVPRFVHCGSEAALLAGEPLVDADETAPLRPDSRAAYCAVKAEAEQIVLEANTADFAAVSIRPRFVWGPDSILTDGLVAAAKAGRFAWIDGGRHTTDVTFVENAVEGLMLGWRRGRPGQAYFVTDQHRVVLREFLETLFEIYGVDTPIAELDAETAAREVPVPARWFLGQPCILRTDKAVAELGYAPIVSHTAGLDAVRAALATKESTMNRPLTGRTALVTGGTRGLGAAIVRVLAARGATVAFSYVRSSVAAESLSREIRAGGGTVEAFQADQADPTAAAGLPGRVLDRFGALDILVANASIDAFGRVDDPDRDEALFDRFWAVTRTGLMATVRAASRVISDDGRIVLIGSNQGTRASAPGVADNAASKAAIDGYARGLARDLGPRRVTANVVHAGPMDTDLIASAGDKIGPLIERLCLPRFGTVDEVAAAVAFLAGPDAAYITGATLDVDGGYNA